MEDFTNVHYVALWGFGIAAVFGFVANKTHFCVMGAISDALHMGSKGRLGAWFLAIGIAVVGAQILDLLGYVDLGESRYLTTNFGWLGNLLGGILFGVGMTLAAGCGQRNLVRFGGGNLKALVVLLVMGVTAYMTIRGLLAVARINTVELTNVDLSVRGFPDQSIASAVQVMTGWENGALLQGVLAGLVGIAFIGYAIKQEALRDSFDNILAGVVIGSAIIAAWYVTGHLGVDDFDPVPVESMSFIAATGNTIYYLMSFSGATVNFGIALVFGMIAGSFLYAASSGHFRIETFTNRGEMISHLVGAALMGVGGVLSLGCTIGQGVTGMSTLALGSVIALVAIVLGSVLTMKVQYHLLDDRSFPGALAAALADLIVPGRKEIA